MENDSTGPWVGWDSGIQRLDAPLRAEANSRGSGAAAEWIPRSLSTRSHEAFQFKELVQTIPDIREERIMEVRGDLEGGTYRVMAERIAEKIIGDDLLRALL